MHLYWLPSERKTSALFHVVVHIKFTRLLRQINEHGAIFKALLCPLVLAVYDNDCSIRSGTGMTVNYARKKGLPITLIHPDKATISKEKPER